jgi:hypothetical protein
MSLCRLPQVDMVVAVPESGALIRSQELERMKNRTHTLRCSLVLDVLAREDHLARLSTAFALPNLCLTHIDLLAGRFREV